MDGVVALLMVGDFTTAQHAASRANSTLATALVEFETRAASDQLRSAETLRAAAASASRAVAASSGHGSAIDEAVLTYTDVRCKVHEVLAASVAVLASPSADFTALQYDHVLKELASNAGVDESEGRERASSAGGAKTPLLLRQHGEFAVQMLRCIATVTELLCTSRDALALLRELAAGRAVLADYTSLLRHEATPTASAAQPRATSTPPVPAEFLTDVSSHPMYRLFQSWYWGLWARATTTVADVAWLPGNAAHGSHLQASRPPPLPLIPSRTESVGSMVDHGAADAARRGKGDDASDHSTPPANAAKQKRGFFASIRKIWQDKALKPHPEPHLDDDSTVNADSRTPSRRSSTISDAGRTPSRTPGRSNSAQHSTNQPLPVFDGSIAPAFIEHGQGDLIDAIRRVRGAVLKSHHVRDVQLVVLFDASEHPRTTWMDHAVLLDTHDQAAAQSRQQRGNMQAWVACMGVPALPPANVLTSANEHRQLLVMKCVFALNIPTLSGCTPPTLRPADVYFVRPSVPTAGRGRVVFGVVGELRPGRDVTQATGRFVEQVEDGLRRDVDRELQELVRVWGMADVMAQARRIAGVAVPATPPRARPGAVPTTPPSSRGQGSARR